MIIEEKLLLFRTKLLTKVAISYTIPIAHNNNSLYVVF